jgi:hypothetical protein
MYRQFTVCPPNVNVQTVSRLSAQRSVQTCHLTTCNTLNTQCTAVHWKWACDVNSEAFGLMAAMTDGLGLFMEVIIGYKKINQLLQILQLTRNFLTCFNINQF